MENNHYVLRGYSNSLIKYVGNEMWQLSLYNNNVTFGTVMSVDYPLGKRQWTIHNSKCFDSQVTEVTLSLNACNDSEFNCDDGQCISMQKRCDSRIDCSDKTGEHCLCKT